MEYDGKHVTMGRADKHLNIKIPVKHRKSFSLGAIAIRNRHILEVMAVAIKPVINEQVGRGANVYSPLTDGVLSFPTSRLGLPQFSTKWRKIPIKEKDHSLRNGTHFPIFVADINELFSMK